MFETPILPGGQVATQVVPSRNMLFLQLKQFVAVEHVKQFGSQVLPVHGPTG